MSPLAIKHRLGGWWTWCRSESDQAMGCLAGAAGAWMISQNTDYSKWGWIAFLLSNALLLLMAWRKSLWPLLTLQVYYAYTSINGIAHYF